MSTTPHNLELPVATPTASDRLSGRMTTTQLVLSVLAFSSPLTCLAGYFSLTIMSTGSTAPVAFVIVTVVLLIFSVGYMAMTKHMPRPGAFYAYISEGLGRRMGLAAAFLATLSYTVIGMGVYCFAGLTVTDLVSKYGGPDIPWWTGTLVVWLIISTLGYFNVEVSAKVLMWVMFVEVSIVMIFNVAVIGQGGKDGLSLAPFDVPQFFSNGDVAVGLLFAMLVFIGFEATALYRDEVREPNKTIPRATYIAVFFIGILYTLTVWVMVMAFGSDAQQVATSDTAGMFGLAADNYIGVWFSNIATALVVTAVLASLLSIHNASTRYLFNLSADGALPKAFGAVHGRHRSPTAPRWRSPPGLCRCRAVRPRPQRPGEGIRSTRRSRQRRGFHLDGAGQRRGGRLVPSAWSREGRAPMGDDNRSINLGNRNDQLGGIRTLQLRSRRRRIEQQLDSVTGAGRIVRRRADSRDRREDPTP